MVTDGDMSSSGVSLQVSWSKPSGHVDEDGDETKCVQETNGSLSADEPQEHSGKSRAGL